MGFKEMGMAAALAAAGCATEGCNKPHSAKEDKIYNAAVEQYNQEVRNDVCGSNTGADCEIGVATRLESDGLIGKDAQRIKQIESEMTHPDSPK